MRDKVRNKEDKRKAYRQAQSKLQYQKKLRSSYRTDTGFDVICSCCLQYKNATACHTIDVLSAKQQKKFTIKSCNLLKNRSEGFFICASCKTDIDKDKIPKRSHKDTFKYANFPTNLITKLKRTCKKSINSLSEHFKEKQELEDRKSVQMNKLESFLLKLAIPFIRIAHCPRGPYLKVKGDLILISADLSHSLSKILPHNQSLIPVAFKRKLAYSGSYLEEMIEKEKVVQYFSWLKKYNHLYKDFEIDPNLIEEFKATTKETANEFEKNTKDKNDNAQVDEDSPTDQSFEDEEDFFQKYSIDSHQPPENSRKQDYTSMFFNKYCEDTNLPTVSNRFADVVVDFELSRNIEVGEDDDFDVEDSDLEIDANNPEVSRDKMFEDKNSNTEDDEYLLEETSKDKPHETKTKEDAIKEREETFLKEVDKEIDMIHHRDCDYLENDYIAFLQDIQMRKKIKKISVIYIYLSITKLKNV